MSKSSAVVLCSGGLRSLVAAGVASREYRTALLHIKDGRVTQERALGAFGKQVTHFKPIRHWVIEGVYLRQMALPVETAGLVSSTSSDPHAQLIPLRELQLLMLAAGFARQIRATTIVWGAQYDAKETDAVAKTVETVQLFNQLIDLQVIESPPVVKTPLMGLTDQQVLELGYQMSLPFAASWSCQTDVDRPCMACPACVRRVRAFRAAQLTDPLVARK